TLSQWQWRDLCLAPGSGDNWMQASGQNEHFSPAWGTFAPQNPATARPCREEVLTVTLPTQLHTLGDSLISSSGGGGDDHRPSIINHQRHSTWANMRNRSINRE